MPVTGDLRFNSQLDALLEAGRPRPAFLFSLPPAETGPAASPTQQQYQDSRLERKQARQAFGIALGTNGELLLANRPFVTKYGLEL